MDAHITELATQIRNSSDEFSGREAPEDVCAAILGRHLEELQEEQQAVADKREELRQRFGVSSEAEASDGSDGRTDAERKQAELREQMGQ